MLARQIREAERLAVERERDRRGDSGRIGEGVPSAHVEEQRWPGAGEPAPQLLGIDALEATRRHVRTIADPGRLRRAGVEVPAWDPPG